MMLDKPILVEKSWREIADLRSSRKILSCCCVVALLHCNLVMAAPDYNVKSHVVNAVTKEKQSFGLDGNLNNFFKQQKAMVYRLIKNLGYDPEQLPGHIRAEIDRPATTNLKAFVAFSKGLDLLDRGQPKAARMAFDYASSLDGNFKIARDFQRRIPTSDKSVKSIVKTAVSRAQIQVRQLINAPTKQLVTPPLPPQPVVPNIPTAKEISDQVNEAIDNAGKMDIDVALDTIPVSVDLMNAVHNNPTQATQLLKKAIQSNLDVAQALESVLFATKTSASDGDIKDFLTSAIDGGLSANDAVGVVKSLKGGGGSCQ